MKDDKHSGRLTIRTDDNIAAVDKMVNEDRNVRSQLITITLGIPNTVVLWILRGFEDMKTMLKICSTRTGTRANERRNCCAPKLVKHD